MLFLQGLIKDLGKALIARSAGMETILADILWMLFDL